MSDGKDGGGPVHHKRESVFEEPPAGITMRDWFAGQAYQIADAMLKERAK